MSMRLLLPLVALVLTACEAAPAARPTTAPGQAASDAGVAQGGATTAPGMLQPSDAFDRAEVTFVADGRRVAMPVLVADTPELRSTGLMRREDLPADAGMIFVYDAPTEGAFWMKDTLLPLTIAFVGDDGVVQQLTDMEPCTVADEDCRRYAAERPYRYAIEANQGYYDRHGITPGWTVEVPDAIGGTS
jgi:uncharacterized membrane protein (UPF0127 family)